MKLPKTDNPMYKITLQIILVKWIMIQNDINKYDTHKVYQISQYKTETCKGQSKIFFFYFLPYACSVQILQNNTLLRT
jgi:hypothetical protein